VNVLLAIALAASANYPTNATLRPVWSIPVSKSGGFVMESPAGPVVFNRVRPEYDVEICLLSRADGHRLWEQNQSAEHVATSIMYNVGQSVVQVGVTEGQGFTPNQLHLFDPATGETQARQMIDDGYVGFDYKPNVVDGNAFFLAPANKMIKVSRLWWVDAGGHKISEVKSFAENTPETNPRLLELLANKTIGFSRQIYRFDSRMRPRLFNLEDGALGRPRSTTLIASKYALAGYAGGQEGNREDEPRSALPMGDTAQAFFDLRDDGSATRKWLFKSELKYAPHSSSRRDAIRKSPPLSTLREATAIGDHLYGLIDTPDALVGRRPTRNLVQFDDEAHLLNPRAAEEVYTDIEGHAWIAEQGQGYPMDEGRLVLHPLENLASSITLITTPGAIVGSLSIDPKNHEFALVANGVLSVYR